MTSTVSGYSSAASTSTMKSNLWSRAYSKYFEGAYPGIWLSVLGREGGRTASRIGKQD